MVAEYVAEGRPRESSRSASRRKRRPKTHAVIWMRSAYRLIASCGCTVSSSGHRVEESHPAHDG